MRRIIHSQLQMMFPIILLVLLLTYSGPTLALSFPAQNDSVWEILDHDYTASNAIPWDVDFVNATHGWVLSQNESAWVGGIILRTGDSGDSWHLQYYNESQQFRHIFTIDEDTLWVSGRSGLFYSENCGQNWSFQSIGSADEFFYGVFFLNITHGWTASIGNMYTTDDGGQTWDLVDSWNFDDTARMIHFVSDLEGWAIGFEGIYYTNDGCETWIQRYNYGGWAMSFVSETEAWAVADGWVAHMGDGETWYTQAAPRTSPFPPPLLPYYSDIQFLDTNNGWIVGDEAKVIYTPNGGLDWYSQEFPGDRRLTAVHFINLTHGWAVGNGGYIYRTAQGNSLGSRLYTGFADPVFLSIIGIIATAVVLSIGSVFYWRKRKRVPQLDKTTEQLGVALE